MYKVGHVLSYRVSDGGTLQQCSVCIMYKVGPGGGTRHGTGCPTGVLYKKGVYALCIK